MSGAWLLLAVLAADRPVVQTLAFQPDAARPTLVVTASVPLPAPQGSRAGDTLTLSWPAQLASGATAPSPLPPVRALRLSERAGQVVLEITLDPAVPYEVAADGPRTRLMLGAATGPRSDVTALWGSLFPPSADPETDAPADGAVPKNDAPESSGDGAREEGIALGPLVLRPALEALYVRAESTFESPQPVDDTYYEVRPRLSAHVPLGSGVLTADYETRFRRESRFADVEKGSHFANAGLELPIGTRLTLRVSDHYARGILETREIDPGGEYFFGLGRYERNRLAGEVRLQTAGRLRLSVGASLDQSEVDDRSSFFGYDRQAFEGRLGYELSPRLTASLYGAYDRIPTPDDRPIAEGDARSAGLELRGDLGPLTTAEVLVGVRDQENPRAGEGGRTYRGLVVTGSLRRELGREATLRLSGTRATFPSAFEQNAFYVASGGGIELDLPAPAAIVLRLAAGYHWNDYRTPAADTGSPRRDTIWDGAVGLARSLSRRAWVRADYRRERRNSDLDVFDVTTHALTVQVGVGFLGSPAR
ncbi:MAG: outer membrane beta-barrel protein [Vicinamibacteria bacterium]